MTLIPLIPLPPLVSLVANSGIQFLDFGLTPGDGADYGHFVRHSVNGPLLCLQRDPASGRYQLPASDGHPAEIVRPELRLPLEDSLARLTGHWLPLPLARRSASQQAPALGWAKVRICALDAPDERGNSHRVTLAFDTRLGRDAQCQPTADDLEDTHFYLDGQHSLGQPDTCLRLQRWLAPLCAEADDESAGGAHKFRWQGHWLNLLQLLMERLTLPALRLVTHPDPLAVDLILDLGSRRIAGLLNEPPTAGARGLATSVPLTLRQLDAPEQATEGVFDAAVAFADCPLTPAAEYRPDAREPGFVWPSLLRCGPEAERILTREPALAGLSSPLRYLWDARRSATRWHTDDPGYDAALARWLDDDGEPLADDGLQFPAFDACYPRRSLVTLQLCELIAHALCQMNSVAHRLIRGEASRPRQLQRVIVSAAAGMAPALQHQLQRCIDQACLLVWRTLELTSPRPQGIIGPDAASACQWMWLYQQHQQAHAAPLPATLRLATLDIGGGHSQLALVDYRLRTSDDELQVNAATVRTRSVALGGDRLLLDLLQQVLFPALVRSLAQQGVSDPERVVQLLAGNHRPDARLRSLLYQSQQWLWRPLALRLMTDSSLQLAGVPHRLGSLADGPQASGALTALTALVRRHLPAALRGQGLEELELHFDWRAWQQALEGGRLFVSPALEALAASLREGGCDRLLLTGGASIAPGLAAWLTQRLALEEHQVISLSGMAVGPWFHERHHGQVRNTKDAAVCGALLQLLAAQLALPGVVLGAATTHQPPQTPIALMAAEEASGGVCALDGERLLTVNGPLRLGLLWPELPALTPPPLWRLTINNAALRRRLAVAARGAEVTFDWCDGELSLARADFGGQPLTAGELTLTLNPLTEEDGLWFEQAGFVPLAGDGPITWSAVAGPQARPLRARRRAVVSH